MGFTSFSINILFWFKDRIYNTKLFSQYVSSVFSGLILRLSLLFMTLAVLVTIGQVLYEMPLIWGLSDVFLISLRFFISKMGTYLFHRLCVIKWAIIVYVSPTLIPRLPGTLNPATFWESYELWSKLIIYLHLSQ